jgi:hypothetical protein
MAPTVNTIRGLPPEVWWQKSLTEGIMGTTGMTVDEALDEYWQPEFQCESAGRSYDRAMLKWHLEWVRREGDIKTSVQHATFDGEFFAAVHTVEGSTEKGEYEVEAITFARIVDDRIAWLKELYRYVRGEETSFAQEFDAYPAGEPAPPEEESSS